MPKSDVVYHYTSAETLLKIVESQSLWATNLRYLNDVLEADHCVNLMKERLPAYLADRDCPLRKYLEMAIKRIDRSAWGRIYVASFSAARDSLPLWRAYCANGNGVSIGFRISQLRQSKISGESRLHGVGSLRSKLKKVRYIAASDGGQIDSLIEACVDYADQWLKKQPEAGEGIWVAEDSVLLYAIEKIASTVKHPSFSSEMEYRLIAADPYWATEDVVRFRSSKTTVIPYIEIRMPERVESGRGSPEHSPRVDDHFIDEVVVGPAPNPELTSSALRLLFLRRNLRVQVSESQVPYRDL